MPSTASQFAGAPTRKGESAAGDWTVDQFRLPLFGVACEVWFGQGSRCSGTWLAAAKATLVIDIPPRAAALPQPVELKPLPTCTVERCMACDCWARQRSGHANPTPSHMPPHRPVPLRAEPPAGYRGVCAAPITASMPGLVCRTQPRSGHAAVCVVRGANGPEYPPPTTSSVSWNSSSRFRAAHPEAGMPLLSASPSLLNQEAPCARVACKPGRAGHACQSPASTLVVPPCRQGPRWVNPSYTNWLRGAGPAQHPKELDSHLQQVLYVGSAARGPEMPYEVGRPAVGGVAAPGAFSIAALGWSPTRKRARSASSAVGVASPKAARVCACCC